MVLVFLILVVIVGAFILLFSTSKYFGPIRILLFAIIVILISRGFYLQIYKPYVLKYDESWWGGRITSEAVMVNNPEINHIIFLLLYFIFFLVNSLREKFSTKKDIQLYAIIPISITVLFILFHIFNHVDLISYEKKDRMRQKIGANG
jgi:hypothetical protein